MAKWIYIQLAVIRETAETNAACYILICTSFSISKTTNKSKWYVMRVIMVKDVALCNINLFLYEVMIFLYEGVLIQQMIRCDHLLLYVRFYALKM